MEKTAETELRKLTAEHHGFVEELRQAQREREIHKSRICHRIRLAWRGNPCHHGSNQFLQRVIP
jgi:hypothetical protein